MAFPTLFKLVMSTLEEAQGRCATEEEEGDGEQLAVMRENDMMGWEVTRQRVKVLAKLNIWPAATRLQIKHCRHSGSIYVGEWCFKCTVNDVQELTCTLHSKAWQVIWLLQT